MGDQTKPSGGGGGGNGDGNGKKTGPKRKEIESFGYEGGNQGLMLICLGYRRSKTSSPKSRVEVAQGLL